MKQDVFRDCFANGLPANEGAALAATQRPLSTTALTDVSGVPAWKTIPSWAVVGTADKVIPTGANSPWRGMPARTSPRSGHRTWR